MQIYKAYNRQHLTFEKFTPFQETGNVLWEKSTPSSQIVNSNKLPLGYNFFISRFSHGMKQWHLQRAKFYYEGTKSFLMSFVQRVNQYIKKKEKQNTASAILPLYFLMASKG